MSSSRSWYDLFSGMFGLVAVIFSSSPWSRRVGMLFRLVMWMSKQVPFVTYGYVAPLMVMLVGVREKLRSATALGMVTLYIVLGSLGVDMGEGL